MVLKKKTSARLMIGMIGAFDSKGTEFGYLHEEITRKGADVYAIDIGVFPSRPGFKVHLSMAHARNNLLRGSVNSRVRILKHTARALSQRICDVVIEQNIAGIIGMGGASGSAVIAQVLQALPVGFPKIIVSTCAGVNGSEYIRGSDIVLVPAIVDISGLNSISKRLFASAASLMRSLISSSNFSSNRPAIGLTMLGNTTPLCDLCRDFLVKKGFEVIVFHANGYGGRNLEAMISSGEIQGVLDLTTTEIGNHEFGGDFDAGSKRLCAAHKFLLPVVVAPGGVDFIVMKRTRSLIRRIPRNRWRVWNDDLVLVRTTRAENIKLGRIFASKLNKSPIPIAVVLPERGFSLIGQSGNSFYAPRNDKAFIDALLNEIDDRHAVEIVDAQINSQRFALVVVSRFLALWERREQNQAARVAKH